MVGIGRACLLGDFFAWRKGVAWGVWGLVLWKIFFLGMLREGFLRDGMGFVMSL